MLALIVGLAYWFDWKDQIDRIDAEKVREDQLKASFVDKKKQALDLPAYRKQLEDIEKLFGALLKQLPGKSELDALLTDINRDIALAQRRYSSQQQANQVHGVLPANFAFILPMLLQLVKL